MKRKIFLFCSFFIVFLFCAKPVLAADCNVSFPSGNEALNNTPVPVYVSGLDCNKNYYHYRVFNDAGEQIDVGDVYFSQAPCDWRFSVSGSRTGQYEVLIFPLRSAGQRTNPICFGEFRTNSSNPTLVPLPTDVGPGGPGVINLYLACGDLPDPTCKTCIDDGDAWTALGCIPTDPAAFVAWVLARAISIGGGIAFLLMIGGGFTIMTSSGNPEQLNKGKSIITSAATGLLFIIFSVLLLKIIGIDILKLPGFAP